MAKSFEEFDSLKNENIDDSLFQSTRGLLIFGRLIGLLPYKGIFSKSSLHLKFSWISIPSVISYIVFTILTFNVILEILVSVKASKNNAYNVVQSIRYTLYYVWGTVIYLNFIVRANSFLNIFKAWRFCSVYFTKPDLTLKRDVVLIAVLILVSGALENLVLYGGLIQDAVSPKIGGGEPFKTNSSLLQTHYYSFLRSWANVIPYSPYLSVLGFIQHKCILFGWNYMDILIAVLGRALYFKFQSLCESANAQLVKPLQDKPRFTHNVQELHVPDKQAWLRVVRDHRVLCELLQVFEEFLSPLIFCSYTINVYYISMQLLDGLTVDVERHTWNDAINKPWSFIHLIMRTYILSICCSKINTHAHQISEVINDCPPDFYSGEISRLDKRISGGRDIGLSGLKCFTVTKPFFLSFIGVIFTFEIVLLQVIPPPEVQTGDGQKC